MTGRSFAFGTALACLALAGVANAQIAPGDTGRGTELGLSEENNSGQTGTVTLFRHGRDATLVVISLAAEPAGKVEPAHVHRGPDCDALDPTPAFPLAPAINGVSKTIVLAPEDKLLSGNYNVSVHSAIRPGLDFACGHLYR